MRPNVDEWNAATEAKSSVLTSANERDLVCLECMAHYRLAPADAAWLTACPVCDLELTELEAEDKAA